MHRAQEQLITRLKARHVALWLALSMLALPRAGLAWLFPEHRDITVAAIQELGPEQRAAFDKLWSEARSAHEQRLCADPTDPQPGAKPTCVDFASWPAIAGDHSCSAQDLLNTVLEAPWVLEVEQISAKLKAQLAAAKRRDQRLNAVLESNVALQRADQDLFIRALRNGSHFMLTRPDVGITPQAYGKLALGAGARLNALGTYAWYHMRALEAAERLAHGDLAPDARAQEALTVLADEAFAAHFIEDAFAAGHSTGDWGDSAVRLGTHDYYNEHGIEAVTWKGEHYVAQGDAYMRPEDEERASGAVRDSLDQVLAALEGKAPEGLVPAGGEANQPEGFNVCRETHFPADASSTANLVTFIVPIIVQTPVPALAAGKGELPRFRAEFGPFIGVSSAVAAQGLSNGFGTNQNSQTAVGSLELALSTGYGLEGVMSEQGDGLVFAELGLRYDTSSKLNGSTNALGSATATFPARQALTLRFRCPFWLIPGDLILAAPVLAFTSPKTLTKMAVEAGNGGLIPYQAGIATPIGRLQFVLGREVGISFYGYRANDVFVLPTPGVPPVNATSVDMRSIQWEFPVLEYRPFRSFSEKQTSSVLIQLYFGVDVPTGWTVVAPPGAPKPDTQNVWVGGLRIIFDWRHYF